MSSLRVVATAASSDLLALEQIRNVLIRSVVNLFAAGVTKGDQLSFFHNRTELRAASNINIEISADVIDCGGRDQIVFNAVMGRGTLRLPVNAVTTEVQAELSVEPLV